MIATAPEFDLVICVASGFTVKQFHRSDMRRLSWDLRRQYLGQKTFMQFAEWDYDWRGLARRVHQVARPDAHMVWAGHSWGDGCGYTRWEREWGKLGRAVDLAVLFDPVPWHWTLGGKFVGGLTAWGDFKVRNARNVVAFRQLNDKPRGREVAAPSGTRVQQYTYGSQENLRRHGLSHDGHTVVTDGNIGHNSIDGDSRVRDIALGEIEASIAAWRKAA